MTTLGIVKRKYNLVYIAAAVFLTAYCICYYYSSSIIEELNSSNVVVKTEYNLSENADSNKLYIKELSNGTIRINNETYNIYIDDYMHYYFAKDIMTDVRYYIVGSKLKEEAGIAFIVKDSILAERIDYELKHNNYKGLNDSNKYYLIKRENVMI